MITISLDEYGNFERDEHKPLFIAGLIYDDNQTCAGDSHIEVETERERIVAYYKCVMDSVGNGVTYPQDLHSNGDAARDRTVVRPVKSKVAESLPEFLEKGTFGGRRLVNDNGRMISDRKGKYHLFVMLKSDDGKRRLLSENANMLAKDDQGANLYFHMASSVVNRVIFHNPIYEPGHMPAVAVDVASRSTGDINGMEDSLQRDFLKQGYRLNRLGSGNGYYSIMNADIYRTLIAQEMINMGNVSAKIELFHVSSIKYDTSHSRMEFLYLSDSICSILGYKLSGNSADDWLGQIIRRTNEINPSNENLVFGYDEIDIQYAKAWEAYERKAYFDALSLTYDGKTCSGCFAKHYRDVWFPYLEERVRKTISPMYFQKSINELSAMLQINNLNQEKLLYLMQMFELMIPNVWDKYRNNDMRSRDIFKLYDAGVSAFCHVGNAKKAIEYYEKCKPYSYYVGINEFLSTNTKLVVCLEDIFEWNKAEKVAKENMENQQLISEIKREIYGQKAEVAYLDEAKAISQYARILALKRDPEAENFFRRALGMLEKGSANYKITQSYLLHFYADMNLQVAFDEEIQDFFDGRKTFSRQLRYIMSTDENFHSVFSKEYALYLLLRGLLYFHQDEIDAAQWKKLCGLDEELAKMVGKEPSGHPWEITYKYLEMLAIKRNDKEARMKFARLKKKRLSYRGEIITALEQFGEAELADVEADIRRRDSITSDLVNYLQNNFSAIKNVSFSDDGELRYQELQMYFTFMYR